MNRLLIRGGMLLDGAPRARKRRLDLLVEGDRIARIGPTLRAPGARVLDAGGLLVAPGFIDTHAHSDGACLVDPSAQGRLFDGVTSEIDGSCGASLFPRLGPSGESIGESLRRQGVEEDWRDAEGYFHAVEARGSAINRGFLVGHGTVRAAVTGYAAKAAGSRQLARMRRLVAESLDQGALGLSSGLCYAPGCFAKTAEIAELCRALAPTSRPYCTHMRNEGRGLMRSIREALAIAERSGAPLHVSHIKTLGRANWWKIDSLERALFEARRRGLDVTADRYPYLAAMTGLGSIFPDWFHAGGREKALARLERPAIRKRLRGAMEHAARPSAGWEDIRIAMAGQEMQRFEGMTVQAVALELGLDPFDAVCELLRRAEFQVTAVFFHMNEDNLARILRWPFTSVGSDSTARSLTGPTAQGRPHPRTFGTFGRFLGEYVVRRKVLPLPEAISRITRRAAERFQLRDRGVLRTGAFADIVVLDLDRFRDTATYEKPFSLTKGVRHLLVNGEPVILRGRETGARPGRVLRFEG
jgi:N-acyl-D-amino-acid deacylase